jgi:hypothetical protein
MAIKFNRSQTFATNGTVDAPSLHNLVDGLDIYQSLITDQTNVTSVSTADELLIAIDAGSEGDAPKAVTVQELFQDALTAGTYTNANISEALTYGTATGTRLVSTNATITTGTITTGVIPTLTAGTTTSTAATITSGTITNLASTTGTIATLNSTTGTVATLNSTTGTIGNLSTTLAGDFTISAGTGTLGTTGVTAGTYGDASAIPFVTIDAKGRITSATTGTFSTTPADGSITPAKLSQPFTSGTAVASTSGTAIDFTGIPSWVKRVTVMFSGISLSSTGHFIVQIGSGSITSSGYSSTFSFLATDTNANSTISTIGFGIWGAFAGGSTHGNMQIMLLDSSSFLYASSHSAGEFAGPASKFGGGSVTLSGTLDRVRIIANGPDTFDGGSINIMYEG